MAHVRSIEQQYWALSQQQIQLWSRETAVKLGEEIVRRERAELEAGRGTTPTSPRPSRTSNGSARLHHGDVRHDHDRAAAPEHPRPPPGG